MLLDLGVCHYTVWRSAKMPNPVCLAIILQETGKLILMVNICNIWLLLWWWNDITGAPFKGILNTWYIYANRRKVCIRRNCSVCKPFSDWLICVMWWGFPWGSSPWHHCVNMNHGVGGFLPGPVSFFSPIYLQYPSQAVQTPLIIRIYSLALFNLVCSQR